MHITKHGDSCSDAEFFLSSLYGNFIFAWHSEAWWQYELSLKEWEPCWCTDKDGNNLGASHHAIYKAWMLTPTSKLTALILTGSEEVERSLDCE